MSDRLAEFRAFREWLNAEGPANLNAESAE